MSSTQLDALGTALFSEILATDQILKSRISKVLPKGMELSHFVILNHLAGHSEEVTPAQLAHRFNLTKGAVTNTMKKLEQAGHIHVRPDWDDARRKWVRLSDAGLLSRDTAILLINPIIQDVCDRLGDEKLRQAVRLLRDIRSGLND